VVGSATVPADLLAADGGRDRAGGAGIDPPAVLLVQVAASAGGAGASAAADCPKAGHPAHARYHPLVIGRKKRATLGICASQFGLFDLEPESF